MRAISLLFHDVYVAEPGESGFQSAAADRYKLSLAAFEAQLAGITSVRTDAPALVTGLSGASPSASPAGHRHSWRAALRQSAAVPTPFLLTVDDGGVSYYTQVADRLEALGWRGHCFVSTDAIGRRGFLDAAQIRELDARGHVIGSHSASHPPRISACPVETLREEWARSRQVLEDLLGREVTAASVPGGYYSRRVARTAREAGLRLLFTSEPTTVIRDHDGIAVIGRFTIRSGHASGISRRLVLPAPWTRCAEWAGWNAKGLVKPLLGPAYMRVADWILAGSGKRGPTRSAGTTSATSCLR